MILRIDERYYQEIIAQCEDPTETFDDIQSRTAGPDSEVPSRLARAGEATRGSSLTGGVET